MIRSHSVVFGPDYVELKWTAPKYAPVWYQLKYMVTLKPICIPNNGTHDHTKTKEKNLSSETTSVTISSSSCKLNLLAVYNPANIDKGIDIASTTVHENAKAGWHCIISTLVIAKCIMLLLRYM